MTRVCFGRVRAEFQCCVPQIFSQESQIIADYENINLARKRKGPQNLKTPFSPPWIFHYKFAAQELASSNFLMSVLVLSRNILCWSVAIWIFNKNYLCLLHRFGRLSLVHTIA